MPWSSTGLASGGGTFDDAVFSHISLVLKSVHLAPDKLLGKCDTRTVTCSDTGLVSGGGRFGDAVFGHLCPSMYRAQSVHWAPDRRIGQCDTRTVQYAETGLVSGGGGVFD